MDINIGNYKLKLSGSSAGHNGLKNIEECLKTKDYKRLKIGISKNLRGRVNSIKKETNYNIRILSKFFISSSGIAYDLEFLLHELFKEFSYKPMMLFGGYTECFKYIDVKEFEYLLNHLFDWYI